MASCILLSLLDLCTISQYPNLSDQLCCHCVVYLGRPECAGSGTTKTGKPIGASFAVHGLERWRTALRRPSSGEDSPFHLLNEVVAALVCTGFSEDAKRVVNSAWKPDEAEFLRALVTEQLYSENNECIVVSV